MDNRILRSAALALTLPVAFAACEDDTTAPEELLIEGQVTVDASSPITFQYFDLESLETITVTDAASDSDWDLAFRRFGVKLNGGVGGPGNVEGANLLNSAGKTEAEVLAFTRAYADSVWESVTGDDIAGAPFQFDNLVEAPSNVWFRFDPISRGLVANSGQAWKVRTAEGGHGLVRVVGMVAPNALTSATVEVRYQAPGGTLAAPVEIEGNTSAGPAFYDIETGTTVTPAGCNWDFSFDPGYAVTFNEACDAGTFPLDAAADFTAVTVADDAPDYASFLSAIAGAFPSTFDAPEDVFWYNLEGNQRLWPTYNVFLVRKGGTVFKLQVLDYYDSTGASGYPTVRFEQLR
jgi:hypothetical protein